MNTPVAPAQFLAAGPARFSKAEFIAMCESGAFDDMKIELVRGELERVNFPMSRHTALQSAVLLKLSAAVQGTGLFALTETGIDLSDDTQRTCDASVAFALPDLNRHFEPSELLLAVEVAVSTLDRDMGDKRIDYATAGIANYWVVDAARNVVHVFGEPIDGDYAQVATTRFDQPLAVPGTDRAIVIDG